MEPTAPALRAWWFVAVAAGAIAVAVVVPLVGDGPARAPSPAGAPVESTATTPATPSTWQGPPNDARRKAAVRTGVRVVEAFLDTWRRSGLSVASRTYAVPDQQLRSDAGAPRLRAGSVLDARVSSWESPDHFTLEMSLDLQFEGDPLAWTEGRNDRFVTIMRTAGARRLAFATSP
jgi:hypothetical protein